MCGIAGKLTFDGAPVQPGQIKRMVACLAHRGPDETGVYQADSIGLGHARLSIIDLQGGAQPMSSTDGLLRITFNGEIFNYVELREELTARGHRFATRSDTEVILEAYREYGEECVHHFNGQWAFALWDSSERKLFLSRDRAGIAPLFYTRTRTGFLFASEIKALLASGEVDPELDLDCLDQIFTFWVPLPPTTAFKGIQQLPPAHCLTVKDGLVRVSRYWDITYDPRATATQKEDQLAEQLLALLQDATRIRLRSDVPVGAYLSGGMDSTITAALAKQFIGEGLQTFSVAFEDTTYDESPYQREASAALQTQHRTIKCSESDIADAFPRVIEHAEQPIPRTAPAPLYLLSKLVHESGFKVVLTGEGADEVLGGYDIYKETKIREFWASRPNSQWRPLLLRRLYPYMPEIQRQPTAYLKSFFKVSSADVESPFFSHLPRWQLTARLKTFLSREVKAALTDHDPLQALERSLPPDYRRWNRFTQAEYLEFQYLLPGYILSSQGERMAMAHSIEGRYPFLDHRVIEFSAGLHPNVKMKVLDQKHLLKRACRGLIPKSILGRPKQPYRAPDGRCFFHPAAPAYPKELLAPDCIARHGVFDTAAVSALVNKFTRGQAIGTKDNMALVGILSTQLLLEHFSVHRPGGSSDWISQEKYAATL